MLASFTRLVRFKDPLGRILYGEAPENDNFIGQTVSTYDGSNPWDPNLKLTGKTAEIAEVRRNSTASLTRDIETTRVLMDK